MTPALLYVFPTFAAAGDALIAGDLPDGARVEVERDETQTPVGRRYRYDVYVEPPPSIAPPALINPEPFATLDDAGKLVELPSSGSAGVIDSADYDTFADAVDAVNAAAPAIQGLRLRAGTVHVVESQLALDEGVELLFDPGAVVDVSLNTASLTLRAPVRASRRQIFRCTPLGQTEESPGVAPAPKIIFEGLSRGPVPVEWFGVLPSTERGLCSGANDAAMTYVLQATQVTLDDRAVWLPVSFGVGDFCFQHPIDFGPRAVRGQGHLVTNRGPRGGGYNRLFGGTVLRFPTLITGAAVTFGDGDTDPSPFRVEGFAIIGPQSREATSVGVELARCIEASFVNVCVASFAVGVDACDAQGCSFDRFDVWGCGTGLTIRLCQGETLDVGAIANANSMLNFNFNACDVAVRTDDLAPDARVRPNLPEARRASQWRFIGGTIQGGDRSKGVVFDGAVWLGPRAYGFVFVGVWFEVVVRDCSGDPAPCVGVAESLLEPPGVLLDGGEAHTFIGCRFSDQVRRIEVRGGGVGGHVFRDCYAAVPGSGTLRVEVDASAADVAFERCGSFRVEDPAARASVVGAFGGSGVGAAVVPVRQRLDVAEQVGAPAALQFASLPVGGTGAQVLMQASKRNAVTDDQVALWSLQTAGPDRQSVQLYNEINPLQPDGALAFEFDLAKQWLITAPKGNTVNSGDPTTDNVINNMRTRIAELEAIIQDIAKNAVRRPPAS